MKNEEFATALGGFNKESIMRNKIFNMGKRSMKMTMKLLGAAFFILHSSFPAMTTSTNFPTSVLSWIPT